MPLLIFQRRIKTFPGLHSTAGYIGWRSDFTVAGTASEFHTDFPPYQYALFIVKKFT